MFKIASLVPLNEISIQQIKNLAEEDVKIINSSDAENYNMSDIDILIARDRDVSEQIINKCEKLKILFIVSAGVEKLPFDALRKNKILVANSGDLSAEAMAEHVMGIMLMFSAKLLMSVLNQRKKFWQKFVINETLVNKRILVVGAGKIGQCIAQKAKAFNMNTVGIKSRTGYVPYFDEVYTLKDIDLQLKKADYVVCTLPLTEQTEKLFNYNKFFLMKKEAVFINISRGKIVSESDLTKALENNLIRGAALDVFDPEPLDSESLLWNFENVIITPHSSGRIENFVEKTIPVFIENISEFKKTGELVTKVDLNKKY